MCSMRRLGGESSRVFFIFIFGGDEVAWRTDEDDTSFR